MTLRNWSKTVEILEERLNFSGIGDLEFYNGFDASKPTVVAAHGWFGSVDFDDTFGRSPSYSDAANVIGWEWDAAVLFGIVDTGEASGRELAADLSDFIKADHPDYAESIQLVGHSLGTHVVLARCLPSCATLAGTILDSTRIRPTR